MRIDYESEINKPIEGYKEVECADDCDYCELKCSESCIRFPDYICDGCPCSAAYAAMCK